MKRVDDYKYLQHLIVECHNFGLYDYYLIGLNKRHTHSFIRFLLEIEKYNSEMKKLEIISLYGEPYLFMLGTNMNMDVISKLLIMDDEFAEKHILKMVVDKEKKTFELKIMDGNDSGLKQFGIGFII